MILPSNQSCRCISRKSNLQHLPVQNIKSHGNFLSFQALTEHELFHVAPCSSDRTNMKTAPFRENLTDVLIHREKTKCRCWGVRPSTASESFFSPYCVTCSLISCKTAKSCLSSNGFTIYYHRLPFARCMHAKQQ